MSSLPCHTEKERPCVTQGLLGDEVSPVRLADEHVLLGKVYERLGDFTGLVDHKDHRAPISPFSSDPSQGPTWGVQAKESLSLKENQKAGKQTRELRTWAKPEDQKQIIEGKRLRRDWCQ